MITIDIFKYETLAALEADQQQDRAERIAALWADRDVVNQQFGRHFAVLIRHSAGTANMRLAERIQHVIDLTTKEAELLGQSLDTSYAVQREQLAIMLEREAASGQRWR